MNWFMWPPFTWLATLGCWIRAKQESAIFKPIERSWSLALDVSDDGKAAPFKFYMDADGKLQRRREDGSTEIVA